MDFNNIEHTPRVIFECIKRNVEAFMVPMVYGIPGCGKSALYKKLADHYNLQLIDVRLSNHESVDLTGYPVYENGVAKFVPFLELFPTEDTPIPEGYDGWLILLDEFNHASPEVLHSAHKVVLDRQVGAKNLHPNALVVAAGKDSDNVTLESIKDYADRCVDACILNQATHAVVGGQSFLMYTLCKELLENGITPLMSVLEKCYKHDSTGKREYFFLHQHFIELKD